MDGYTIRAGAKQQPLRLADICDIYVGNRNRRRRLNHRSFRSERFRTGTARPLVAYIRTQGLRQLLTEHDRKLARPEARKAPARNDVGYAGYVVYYVTEIPSEIELFDVAAIGIAAFLLTSLATLYPARRAAHVNPSMALRYE